MEENEQSIDLGLLLKVLKAHLLAIIIAAVVAALAGFALSAFVIPKKYTSEAMMYVENSADKKNDTALNINDINAAQKIVNTCQILFTSNHILEQLEETFQNFTIEELEKMIVIESVNNTEILKIQVTTLNPKTSSDIATRLVELSQVEFLRVIKNGSIEVVSSPTFPEKHTFPSVPIFTVVGFLIGMVVSYAIFLVIELLDVKVKPGDDLMQLYNIPVFAEIMDFESSDKSNYKYNYYSGETAASSGHTASKSHNDEPEQSAAALDTSDAAADSSRKSSGNSKGNKRKESV